MAEPISFDLTAPDGFEQLEMRAIKDAFTALFARYDDLVGVSFDTLADELTEDLMQQSVSLPRSAFVSPEQAGRELAIVKHAYRYFIRRRLFKYASQELERVGAFPTGQPTPLWHGQSRKPEEPPPPPRKPRTRRS